MKKLAILLFAVACMPQKNAVIRPDANAALAGQKLFRQHCASCHGTDAHGTRHAPDLHATDVQAMDHETMFRYVTNGNLREGMPSWSRLTDERRWQIVAYLKSLDPRTGS
jgi:mono/diheme cytochrome c family protein